MTEEKKPCVVVYCGRRWSYTRRALVVEVRIEETDITGMVKIGEERLYDFDKPWGKCVVGGRYDGASLGSNGTLYGRPTQFLSRANVDSETHMAWRAKDSHAEAQQRMAKEEANVKRRDEIADALRDVRKLYDNLRKSHDRAGMYALEYAVVAALKIPPSAKDS